MDITTPTPTTPVAPRTGGRQTFAMVIVVAVVLAAMQIGSMFVPSFVMPPLSDTFGAVARVLANDWTSIIATIVRVLLALSCAAVAGTALGCLMGMSASLRPYLQSSLVFDTGVPALSWMLIAVFWFKNPEIRIFFVLFVILLPFYALNVFDGIKALPKEWIEAIDVFRPTRWQVFRLLILPHIVPYMLLTTKSIIGYATRMVVFAELIGAAIGIGAKMGLGRSDVQDAGGARVDADPRRHQRRLASRGRPARTALCCTGVPRLRSGERDRAARRRAPLRRSLAVDNLSFSVAEGEIVALVGMTGAGKSTALNIVMGTFPAERGSVSVIGLRSVSRRTPRCAERSASASKPTGCCRGVPPRKTSRSACNPRRERTPAARDRGTLARAREARRRRREVSARTLGRHASARLARARASRSIRSYCCSTSRSASSIT